MRLKTSPRGGERMVATPAVPNDHDRAQSRGAGCDGGSVHHVDAQHHGLGGPADSVALTSSGLATGMTAGFSPSSVTARAGSMPTLATTASTPTGTYTVTRHPSPVTRHPSPVTRHPSPVTRHPSPVTRHRHRPLGHAHDHRQGHRVREWRDDTQTCADRDSDSDDYSDDYGVRH
jgi:hypothetical protein